MDKIQHYKIEFDMWWGRISNHCTTLNFIVLELDYDEIRKCIKELSLQFVRQHAYDCGDINYPMGVSLGNIRIIPQFQTVYWNDDTLNEFVNNEREYTGQLIREGRLFVDHQYNTELSPANREKVEQSNPQP